MKRTTEDLSPVQMRCLAAFHWQGRSVRAGDMVTMPAHVALANRNPGRVEYIDQADRNKRTRAFFGTTA